MSTKYLEELGKKNWKSNEDMNRHSSQPLFPVYKMYRKDTCA